MEALETLKDNIGAILKKHAVLVLENQTLRATIAKQELEINSLKNALVKSEATVAEVQFSKPILTDTEKEKLKQYIDSVVSEIDKVLLTFND
jgi:regulator of replication initiation timing